MPQERSCCRHNDAARTRPYRRLMTLVFDVLIEIPRGSRNKYEVDPRSGHDIEVPAEVMAKVTT